MTWVDRFTYASLTAFGLLAGWHFALWLSR